MGEYQLQKASAPADGRTDGRTDGERKPHIFWSLALSIQMTIHYPWPQMVDVCVHVHVYVYIYTSTVRNPTLGLCIVKEESQGRNYS